MFEPSYIALYKTGELQKRAEKLRAILSSCQLCPHRCKVNRIVGEKGRCRSSAQPQVSSYNSHFGEEPPLVGELGSGTIFLTNCTLRCVFCQNYPISQLGNGRNVTAEELAGMYLELQRRGCHNVNFVTPTHFSSAIVDALVIAVERGFRLPLVYNTNGYELVEILQLLDGIIDIYLPDMKYANDEIAKEISGADNYVTINRTAIKEMFRQVGILECDENDIAQRGLIIRHLVLPHNLAGTEEILEFVESEISSYVHFGLMSQYFPAHKAISIDKLKRRITESEYEPLIELLEKYNLENAWTQPL